MVRLLQTVACIVIPASGVLGGDVDIGYDLLFTSAGPDVPQTCFDAPNLDPPVLGSFFQGGPAKFDMGGYTFQSFFDGYGKFNRFELLKGKVCWTAKYMNTSYYREAEMLGRPATGTFMGTDPPLPGCPLLHPMCKIDGMPTENNWVNLMPTNDASEGLVLTDSPVYVRFDYETLETKGTYQWTDGGMMPKWLKPLHIPTTGSAHPVHRPKTESTYIEVLPEVGVSDYVAVVEIDVKTMNRSVLSHVPVKSALYFHSFGVSENYVVLPCNMKMSLTMSLSLVDAFQDGWDGIHVVDLSGAVQVFQTEPFYHTHVVNTFENASGIVFDVGTYDKVPFSRHTLVTKNNLNKTERNTKSLSGNKVERMLLHLDGPEKGKVTREELGVPGRFVDFFKLNHNVWGLPYCIYYGVEWFHNDVDYSSMAVLKHNVCENKRTYWHRENFFVHEPYFLPKGTASSDVEDDGLIMFVALDGVRKASDFIILDGKTMQEIAVVQLPEHIPFLAHGQFVPKVGPAVKEALQMGDTELATVVDKFLSV